ncbi:MAG: BON domain-containing protein [Rhodocyclaceae bacterium]|nr:BON domain-containing protein [Rhodocyclaceae bacterium]
MNNGLRSTVLALALAAVAAPALQGCFPVVATGVGTGALMAADRRSSGAYVEDEGIEWKAAAQIKEKLGDAVHINVTSYNRNVLLTGEAPDANTQAQLPRIVGAVPNIRGITNDVQVAGHSSLTSRSNDTLITSKIKARMIDDDRVQAHLIKVVTEASTVYLMGLVTQTEANDATQVARTTSGVKKVVRVFEYIDAAEARRLDANIGTKER